MSRASSFSSLLPWAGLVVFVVVLIILVYWLSRQSSFRLAELRNRFARSASTSFVGRDAEQKQFLDLTKIDKSGQQQPTWLLLMGGKGLGKRSLLFRYRERALTEKPAVLCGPVIDLAEPQTIDEFLENIASDLSEQCHGTFSDFNSKLRKYRAAAAGKKTGAERAVEITHGLAIGAAGIAGVAGVPAAGLVKGALESKTAGAIAEAAKESVAGTGDRQSLMEAFARDFGALANSQSVHRVVLLFNDLDSRPEDSDIRLLRKEFFPEIAKFRSVLFVGAVEDQQRVNFIESDRRQIQVIKPFDEAESKKYVREVIGLDNAGLVDEVAKRSNGSPQKLAYYRAYFDARPAARGLEHLSADAEAWVVSGEVNQLLQQVANEYLRKVIVSSSPLRWFNVELLQSTAGKANISLDKGEAQSPTALLDPASRPSWIVQVGGGWGIETEQRRRDLIEELRRFSPTLHDDVHRIGAGYHVRRVLMLEGTLDDRIDHDKENVFNYKRKPLTTQRLEDESYVRSVREWLYHLMALAPEKAFPNLADTVAEMLFYDFEGGSRTEASNVEQLLTIGPELILPKRQRLYIELLTRAAFALRQQDHSESVNALRALAAAGAPTPFVKPVIAFLTGASYWRLGLEQEALTFFEKADAGLAELADDPRAVRVRGLNATWLAYTRVRRDRATASAISLLDQSIEAARENLKDVSVVAELERVKALIMEEVGDLDNAKSSYERALKNFEDAGLPEGTASVRRDLSRVLSASGDDEGAARELESASSIYRSLGDTPSHAAVAIEKMALYLKQRDEAKAEEQKQIVLQPEIDSASTRNQIGNAYFAAGKFEAARDMYLDAVKTAPNVAIYHSNLAGALENLNQIADAVKEIEIARQLNPTDQTLLLQNARLMQRADPTKADQLFDQLQDQYEETIAENPQRAESYVVLAELLFSRGKYGDSEKACRDAIARDEKEPYYHHYLGMCLDKLERFDEAAQSFIMATKLAPGRSYIRTWIPYAASRLLPEQGIKILDDALREFPKDAELHFQRGKTLTKLAETVDNRPGAMPAPADMSGAALAASGDGHSSGASALEAEQIAAAANVTLTDREKTLITGRSETANLPATTAIFPDVRGRATLCDAVDLKRQRKDEALKEFEIARDLDPKNVLYLLELAEIWIERQDWTKAETFANFAMEQSSQTPHDPNTTRAQDILKRIQRKQSWNREIGNIAWDVTRIGVEVGVALADWVGETEAGKQFLNEMMQVLREGLQRKTGVIFPTVRFRLNAELGPNDCLINMHEVPRYFYSMPHEYVAQAPADVCRRAGVEGPAAPLPWANAEGTWVTADDAARLRARGIESWDPRGYCALSLMHVIRLHAADFMTVDDAKALLAAGSLSDAVPTESLPRFALALRRLLQEGIPITELSTICDEFSRASETEDIIQVVERIRRLILPWHLAELETDGIIRAGVLSAAFEARYFGAKGVIESRGRRSYLRMRPDDVQDFLSALRDEMQKHTVSALIVPSAKWRRYIHTLVALEFPRVSILSELEAVPGKFDRVFVLN